jgi:hypothetical protein
MVASDLLPRIASLSGRLLLAEKVASVVTGVVATDNVVVSPASSIIFPLVKKTNTNNNTNSRVFVAAAI